MSLTVIEMDAMKQKGWRGRKNGGGETAMSRCTDRQARKKKKKKRERTEGKKKVVIRTFVKVFVSYTLVMLNCLYNHINIIQSPELQVETVMYINSWSGCV